MPQLPPALLWPSAPGQGDRQRLSANCTGDRRIAPGIGGLHRELAMRSTLSSSTRAAHLRQGVVGAIRRILNRGNRSAKDVRQVEGVCRSVLSRLPDHSLTPEISAREGFRKWGPASKKRERCLSSGGWCLEARKALKNGRMPAYWRRSGSGGGGLVRVESGNLHRAGVSPKARKYILANALDACVGGEHFGTLNHQAHWPVAPTVTVPIMDAVRI